MLHGLAYAETGDAGATNLVLIVGGVMILAATVVLAVVLIGVARRRAHRRSELIRNLVILWAILTAGTLLYAGAARMRWSKEYTADVESGYFDPRDTSGKPNMPWIIWTGLAAAYVGMMAWSLSEKEES